MGRQVRLDAAGTGSWTALRQDPSSFRRRRRTVGAWGRFASTTAQPALRELQHLRPAYAVVGKGAFVHSDARERVDGASRPGSTSGRPTMADDPAYIGALPIPTSPERRSPTVSSTRCGPVEVIPDGYGYGYNRAMVVDSPPGRCCQTPNSKVYSRGQAEFHRSWGQPVRGRRGWCRRCGPRGDLVYAAIPVPRVDSGDYWLRNARFSPAWADPADHRHGHPSARGQEVPLDPPGEAAQLGIVRLPGVKVADQIT